MSHKNNKDFAVVVDGEIIPPANTKNPEPPAEEPPSKPPRKQAAATEGDKS